MKSSIAELGLISSWVQMIYQRDTGWEFDDGADSGEYYYRSGDGQVVCLRSSEVSSKEGGNHTHTQAATIFLLGLVNVTRVPCDGVVQVGLYGHVACLGANLHNRSPHTCR